MSMTLNVQVYTLLVACGALLLGRSFSNEKSPGDLR